MTRHDYMSFEEFEESCTAGEWEDLTMLHENGWKKADLVTECKSWKTALKRFFKMIGDEAGFEGWYECLRESAESGIFRDNDCVMLDGSRNEYASWAYEIEEVDDGAWYIFLNVKVA